MWAILVKLCSLQPGIPCCHTLIALLVYLQHGLGLFGVFPLTVTLLPLLAFRIRFHLLFLSQTGTSRCFPPNPSLSFLIMLSFLFSPDCVCAHDTVLGRLFLFLLFFFLLLLLLYPPVCLPICCELRINLSLRRSVNRCGVNHSPGFPFIFPSSQ